MHHFRAEAAHAFFASLTESERELVGHLLECSRCHELAARLLQRERALRFPLPARYEHIWPRLGAALGERLPQIEAEVAAVPRLLARLLAHPEPAQMELIRADEAFQSVPLLSALLAKSYELRIPDPRKAEHFALLSTTLLAATDRGRIPALIANELRARAWCLAGDARRRRGRLAAAEAAFQEASEWLVLTDSRLDQASFCALLAALRRDQGRTQEAHALTDRATFLFRTVAEPREQGEGMEEQSCLHLVLALVDQAISEAARAFALAERRLDARTALEARYLLARCLADQGDFAEARALVQERWRDRACLPAEERERIEAFAQRLRWSTVQGEPAEAEEDLFELLRKARSRLAGGAPWAPGARSSVSQETAP